MMYRYALLAACCFGVGVAHSQAVLQPTSLGSAIDPATVTAAQAKADSAYTLASSAVKSVAGNAPDAKGNAALPSTLSSVTCVNCAMTGTATVNGVPLAATSDVGSEATARIAADAAEVTARNTAIGAISFPVTSVNGATGAVSVPIYTDAMATAANAPAIAAVTGVAKAAGSDVVQVVSPASGGTVAAGSTTTILFINNASLLASLTVTFPANPADGQRFGVFANNTITTLGFTGATSRGALNTLAVSGYARFVYSSSVGVWFRAG